MRPFGYETDRRTIKKDEADLIRQAAADVLEGATIRAIASRWNDADIKTPAGNDWKSVVVKRVLVSPRIAGKVANAAGGLDEAGWPAIVDAETSTKVRELLSRPARAPALPTTTRSYLLTGGMVSCGVCGTHLIARPDNKGQRGYVCSSGPPSNGCGRIRINGRLLEDEVAERLLARLLKPDFKLRLGSKLIALRTEAEAADGTIADARNQEKVLGTEYASGNVSAVTMRSAQAELNKIIAEARRAKRLAAQFENVAVLEADDLVQWWENASLEQQRTLLSVLVEKVEVTPAAVRGSKTFDPSRVKITWRR